LTVKPFGKIPLLFHFCNLLIRPTYTIKEILIDRPGFKRVAFFLFWIGILRGLIEGLWMLAREGQFLPIMVSPVLFKSYMNVGTPFILSSITCGYVRWVGFALLPCLLAQFWGKEARYKDFLRVTGVMMGLYVVTILPNFAYLFFKLPMIQFHVSKVYNPAIGLGQWITAVWLVTIIYKASRMICHLSRFQSWLCGLSVLLVNIGALVLGSLVFFNLEYFHTVSFRGTLNIATYIFIGITIITVPIFLWFGMNLTKQRKIS
jgi:hypothetical protein